MATERVEQIYEEYIKALAAADQLRLVALVVHGLASTVSHDLPHSRSLLELEGLGAEIWPGIGAQACVDELQGEWDQRP